MLVLHLVYVFWSMITGSSSESSLSAVERLGGGELEAAVAAHMAAGLILDQDRYA